jgi:tetratricopeptide (TPR) repeat protein
MSDWLRPLFLMFYAPARGMAEVRDRAPLGFAMLLAFAAHGLYLLFVLWPSMFGAERVAWGGFGAVASLAWKVASSLLFTTLVLVPVVIFAANVIERRASFGLTLRQEYAPVASAVLYARSLASLFALPFAALIRASGIEAMSYEQSTRMLEEFARQGGQTLEEVLAIRPFLLQESFATTIMLPFLAIWLTVAAREALRLSWARALLVVAGSSLALIPLMVVLGPIFDWVFASPLLLLLLFFAMRGYFGEVMRGQRARASFRQNLEASTLNPADASAHYNLGLIHQQREELEEARARFERAIEIDPDEVDAHYQLGRIAREQGRLSEAIAHFEQVVVRDPAHTLYEIWREIGATYVAAGQFGDAQEALGRFLDERPSDPEGLYLMGRAHFGEGRLREAKEWMQRCIDAVKSAPAYKYRADKRWLNEAQQFLRTQA